MKFKFVRNVVEKNKEIVAEYFKFLEAEDDCGHLNHLPVFYAGHVDNAELEEDISPSNGCIETITGKLGTFLSEFHSEPIPWEDFNDEYMKYYPICVCPICGEKLQVEITETVDITEKVKKLEKETKEIQKQMESEDSISALNALREKYNKIQNELYDDLYSDTSFPEFK